MTGFPPSQREMGQPGEELTSARLPLAPSRAVGVQRASDDARVYDPNAQEERATVQGVWYENRVPVSRASEDATTSVSSGPAASASPGQGSETEMDELARKLYDRIRSRLKTELLVDRERAGFLTDLR